MFPEIKYLDIIEVYGDEDMRFFVTDEFCQDDGIVVVDEVYDFKEENITRVWRLVDEDFKCIYIKE